MLISVVITTRNRPSLLRRALASVATQDHPAVELLLVDDGSEDAAAASNAEALRAFGRSGTLLKLPAVPTGHGPSFARNHGAAQASGECLAFLDDDDEWTDPAYLSRAAHSLSDGADLLYANQQAVRADGSQVSPPIWIEDLAPLLLQDGATSAGGALLAKPAQLLRAHGFCHLNTTVMRRTLFEQLGGFDVSLRYEEDRDFQLRAIDRATQILHDPAIVARHHVPQRDSASTRLSADARALDQLRVLDKAILGSTRPELRAYAQRFKGYTLKALARRHAEAGDLAVAGFYAREALGVAPNPTWLAYAAWLPLKRGLRLRPPTSA